MIADYNDNALDLTGPLPANRQNRNDWWCPDLQRARRPGPGFNKSDQWENAGLSTRSVHAGQYTDPVSGAVGTPIFQNTTFYLNEASYRAVDEGRARESFIYARYGNPTQWALQEKLVSLENAQSTVVFSSGMAAITTTLLAMLDRGSHVVTSRDLYGGSYNFFNEDLADLKSDLGLALDQL